MTKETETSQQELPEKTAEAEASAGAAAESEQPAAESDMGALLRKLEETTAAAPAQKARYLRTVADLENYRKRALREKEDARRQANCALVEDLLPVLDTFRLGLKSAEQHEGGAVFAEGFRMILSQMEAALRQNGLEEIHPETEPFDPNFHESVSHQPHESIPDGQVIEVQRTGYKLHERLLRPAAVVVSSGPPSKSGEGPDEAGA